MGIIKKENYSFDEIGPAAVFSMLSHPGRIKILTLLLQHESLSVKEIQQELGLSQAATSQQLLKLKEGGLITGMQVNTSMRYSLSRDRFNDMMLLIGYFWGLINALEEGAP